MAASAVVDLQRCAIRMCVARVCCYHLDGRVEYSLWRIHCISVAKQFRRWPTHVLHGRKKYRALQDVCQYVTAAGGLVVIHESH